MTSNSALNRTLRDKAAMCRLASRQVGDSVIHYWHFDMLGYLRLTPNLQLCDAVVNVTTLTF